MLIIFNWGEMIWIILWLVCRILFFIIIKERGEYKNEVYVEGLETRYTDMCLFRDLDNLTDKVHNKVMEKLADKIADDVVDRILRQIVENKKEKEEKNSF